MKKNGFTLVELLAVIVILSILVALFSPAIVNANKDTRKKAYETKIRTVESTAVMYGQDNFTKIKNGTIRSVKVKDLISANYLSTDNERVRGSIEDPRKPGTYIDECTISLSVNNTTRKVTATYNACT